jgi:hypothetical protein
MSNKRIESYEVYEIPSPSPEKKLEMSFKTADDWIYIYTAAREGEPFTFARKRRPDSKISDDDVTPRSIKNFVDRHPQFEMINEKIVYHDSFSQQIQ